MGVDDRHALADGFQHERLTRLAALQGSRHLRQLLLADEVLDEHGQIVQHLGVHRRPRATLPVEHAERADSFAARCTEWLPGVEPDARLAADTRVVGETWVGKCVVHDERTVMRLPDVVVAEAVLTADLAGLEPNTGLAPLAIAVDERDHRDRRADQPAGDLHDAVVGGLWQRVEDLESV